MIYTQPARAWKHIASGGQAAIINHDCVAAIKSVPDNSIALVVTSPPYCIGKEYESGRGLTDFQSLHEKLFPEVLRVVRPGGSFCWQIGYQVRRNKVLPLDYIIFDILRSLTPVPILRNRIVWTFGHGHHCSRRFSGRHELILWFTKGDDYVFNVDSVRVPQKYPGKTSSKGPKKGDLSGNPLGKNPEDVWDIPNVKANHVEKSEHPCQFPVSLVTRLVRALTDPGDLVLDPFGGVMTTGVASIREKRRFLGIEVEKKYVSVGAERLQATLRGTVPLRDDKPVAQPNPKSRVATKPDHFWPAL